MAVLRVLAVNAGTSSLKLRLLDSDDTLVASRDLPAHLGGFDEQEATDALRRLEGVDAVGHRVVHGGGAFRAPTVLDGAVERRLRTLTELAPLHQPAALAGIAAVRRAFPDVPAVACFDTAFHTDLPAAAATYALPHEWREAYGLRRYGFHGLAHAWASRRAAQLLAGDPGALVLCHLGAGASLAAVRQGRGVDTTMGFTPLEGLVMATRSGSVDPGMLLWLQQRVGIPAPELADALERRSGLAGLAGTPDMREVVERKASGDVAAGLAFDVYIHRLRQGIAAMAASLGGLDTLVFTGGVGENSPDVRAAAVAGLGFVGAALDGARNASASPDTHIETPGSPVRILVVAAREDFEVAAQVRTALSPATSG